MLTLLTIVCTVGMAQDETVWKSLSFPDDNKANNKCNNYTTTWTAKIGDDSWSVSNFNNNGWSNQNNQQIWDHIRCGSKKKASVAAIVNDVAYTEIVTKVVVKIKTASSLDKVNSVRLITASDKNYNNIVETIDGSFGSNSTFTGDLTFNVTKPAKKLFYKFVIDIQKAGNGIISINGVDYYISNSETSTPQPLPPLAPTPARHSHSPMASLRVLPRLQLLPQRATTTPTCLTLLNIQAMPQTS